VLADKEIIMAALNIKSMDFGANFVKVKILLFSHLQLTGGFLGIFFYVLYSALLHLPPLRFHCVGGCWDGTQDCCSIDSQTI
jgi:hypothetical protein